MWILPDGRITRIPVSVVVEDTQHSKQIFIRWSLAELNSIGIHTYSEDELDLNCYSVDDHTDVITDGHCHRTYTLVQRHTNDELRKLIKTNAKALLRGLWREYRVDKDYLLEFEPENTAGIDACQSRITALKEAATLIKADLQGITTYAEAVAYLNVGLASRVPGGI
jgi:hypothetical protein